MKKGSHHDKSFARFIFKHFSKSYGDGHFSHGHIRNKIDYVEQTITVGNAVLRFCMFMQDDFSTYLTVFDESKKNNVSAGIILAVTSFLSFDAGGGKSAELQHVYHDVSPEEGFEKEIHSLFEKNGYSTGGWPLQELRHLKIA